jgi:hypothetical protein
VVRNTNRVYARFGSSPWSLLPLLPSTASIWALSGESRSMIVALGTSAGRLALFRWNGSSWQTQLLAFNSAPGAIAAASGAIYFSTWIQNSIVRLRNSVIDTLEIRLDIGEVRVHPSGTAYAAIGDGSCCQYLQGRWRSIGSPTVDRAMVKYGEGLTAAGEPLLVGVGLLGARRDVYVFDSNFSMWAFSGGSWLFRQRPPRAPDDLWTVGTSDTSFLSSPGAEIHRCTQQACTRLGAGTPGEKSGYVWSPDGRTVFLAQDSSAHVYDGSTVRLLPRPPAFRDRYWNIRGSSPTHVVAITTRGQVFVWDGSTWSELPSIGRRAWRGLWVNSPSDLYVGGCGEIHRWDGVRWTSMPVPNAGCIGSIDGLRTGGALALGDNGRIHRGRRPGSPW